MEAAVFFYIHVKVLLGMHAHAAAALVFPQRTQLERVWVHAVIVSTKSLSDRGEPPLVCSAGKH